MTLEMVLKQYDRLLYIGRYAGLLALSVLLLTVNAHAQSIHPLSLIHI